MLNFFLIGILIICLGLIFYILFGKLAKVRVMDQQSSKISKQLEIKRRLLEERLQRKFSGTALKFKNYLKPLGNLLSVRIRDWYQKIVQLEEIYRHKVLRDSFKDRVRLQQYTGDLLIRAEEFLKEGDLAKAEKAFIDILKTDERNSAAYLGLGNLYLDRRDFDHAKEIFDFLAKLSPADTAVWRSLGDIARVKGDLRLAKEHYQKCLELEPENVNLYLDLAEVYFNMEEPDRAFNLVTQAAAIAPANPKVLDFLIEVSIIVRDRQAALKAFRQLKEVNPENQKLEEFKERIDKL